jgi:hypothetical protein
MKNFASGRSSPPCASPPVAPAWVSLIGVHPSHRRLAWGQARREKATMEPAEGGWMTPMAVPRRGVDARREGLASGGVHQRIGAASRYVGARRRPWRERRRPTLVREREIVNPRILTGGGTVGWIVVFRGTWMQNRRVSDGRANWTTKVGENGEHVPSF